MICHFQKRDQLNLFYAWHYSCRQLNTTIFISHDQDFSGTNQLQIQIQLVKICQKTYLWGFSHNIFGWPNLLSNILHPFWGLWVAKIVHTLTWSICNQWNPVQSLLLAAFELHDQFAWHQLEAGFEVQLSHMITCKSFEVVLCSK
jgi:hypothetical protein